jgi:hypothetical protein
MPIPDPYIEGAISPYDGSYMFIGAKPDTDTGAIIG